MDAATSEDKLSDGRAHDARAMQRVRYETRLRTLTVAGVRQLTPHLTSITLSGDFSGFQSPSFCDHVKLFFPDPVTGVLSLPGSDGAKPIARDYTPRRFDADAQTLDIEFALHGTGAECGPATQWAMTAKAGDTVTIGGPRGSTLIPLAFDAYLLIGDDTALPAIARRLEEMPAGAKVIVMAEVDGPEDRMDFTTQAHAQIHWIYRQTQTLNEALKRMHLPQGDMHAWVACESAAAKLIRTQLIDDHGVNPAYLRASGYWRKGDAGVHDNIDG